MPCVQSPHCYGEPLLPDSIRLLRLLPHQDNTAPIQCELFHYSIQESNKRKHLYDALSYVWGGSDKPRSIFIREHNSTRGHDFTSGHDLPITENLYEALSRFRDCSIERLMWIDAVCINQDNEREKEQQIQSMARIYAQANRVVVWLGEAQEDSDQALQAIRIAGGKNSKIPLTDQTIQQAIVALLQRPWFRRIWVLQEVAAARYILIVCGTIEIDGYAFCLGMDLFEGFNKARADLQNLARSVTYLIRGAIFRPDFYTSRSGRSSLDICALGELVDMYHTHEATKRHDKVFALLGMSTDELSEVNLLLDYSISWEELFRRLIKYLLFKEISVETWGGDGEIAVIKSKGCVLGKVSLAQSDTVQDGREGVDVILENGEGSAHMTLQPSAKSVQDGDIICLLQGASRPSIIRRCQDHFDIIVIAARPPDKIPVEEGYIEWPELSQSGIHFTRDFTLVWDWDNSSEKLQHLEGYEVLLRTKDQISESSTNLERSLDKATRIWNVALILGDLGEYQEAKEKLQEATEGYETAFGIQRLYTLNSDFGLTPLSWATGSGYDAVVQLLLATDGVDPNLKDSKYGQTPLSWAVEEGQEAIVKLLLATDSVDPNLKDEDGWTPLSWAAKEGYEAIVRLLLATDSVDPSLKDKDGQTPLSWAAKEGHEAIFKLLLETGKVEINSKDEDGWTPLSWAAMEGHETIVRLLLPTDGVDPSLKDEDGWTPLSWAAKEGHEAIVRLLLATDGVDPSLKDKDGQTPLSWAAKEGHEAIVRLLLPTDGVDPSLKDEDGWTPLSWAAKEGHEAIVRLLLATDGVDPSLKDEDGWTPLSWAAKEGHEAIVRLLLATDGVDPSLKDKDGQTPLSWAAKEGHEAIAKLLVKTGKVEIDSKDKDGWTPLSWAAKRGDEATVKLLLDTGKIEIDLENENSRTPLSLAAEGGNEDIFKLLLKTGKFEVDSKDKDGWTPLLWAAEEGHEAIVKLLLKTGKVEVDSKDKYGWTPLKWADRRGHKAVAKLLLEIDRVEADSKDKEYWTPLNWAAHRGCEAVVKLLGSRK